MSETESLLVERCLSGDESAMDRFVHRFERLVFRVCLKMLGRREDAEDVAQDVFVRTFRNLDRWDPARPLAPWLVTIAANRCRTALACRARRPENASIQATTIVSRASSQELAEELDVAVQTLRDDYRRCFELFYLEEMSVGEVATRMDVPEGTIKTWLYRARRELADRLERRGILP